MTAPGTGNYLAPRERRADQLERLVVAVVPADGHDHAAVAQVQVEVPDRDSLAADLDIRQERNSITSIPAPLQAPAVLLAVLVVRVVGATVWSSTWPGPRERGDQVYVPVGVAVLQEPHAKPHDRRSRRATDAGPSSIAARDSVGIAAGCSRHCSVISSVPAPSPRIEPPSSTIGARRTSSPSSRAISPADRGIAVPRRELLAPGVEAEMNRDPPAVLVVDVDRAAVAQPGVIERQLDDLHPVVARRPRQRRVRARQRQSSSPARTARSHWRRRRNPPAPARAARPTARAGTATPSRCARGAPIPRASASNQEPKQPPKTRSRNPPRGPRY